MMDRADRYLWLFDSSKTSSLKCEYPLGNDGLKKYRFIYTYKNLYRYLIIEDAKLNNIALDTITDTLNAASSGNDSMDPSEINDWYGGGHIYIQSKLCIDSSNSLQVNTGEPVRKVKPDSLQALFFKGLLKNVQFKNGKYERQYLIKYDKPTQTTILFYKPQKTLYIIVVNPIGGIQDENNGIENLALN